MCVLFLNNHAKVLDTIKICGLDCVFSVTYLMHLLIQKELAKIYEADKTARQTPKVQNAITFSPHGMIKNVFVVLNSLVNVRPFNFQFCITGLAVFKLLQYFTKGN